MTYQLALTALADDTRRQVFETVSRAPMSVGQLADTMPVSRPAVSQHLKFLYDAKLVGFEKRGARNIYFADPAGLLDLRRYLENYWGDVLDAFAHSVENQERPDNDKSDHEDH